MTAYHSRLIHPLAIVSTAAGADDDYGHPTAGTVTTQLVRGLVQPLRASEQVRISQAGAELSDFRIFLPLMRLAGASYIRDEPDAGRRFEIHGVEPHEYGVAPHVEVLAKLVGSTEGATILEPPEGS